MKLLILGASGKTGHHLVNMGLSLGHEITAFVRTPSKLKVKHENLSIVKGNVINAEDVGSAMTDVDIVLSALGAASPLKFDPLLVDGMTNIINAVEKTKLKRLIYLSFIGVNESSGNGGFVIDKIGPVILKNEIKGHELREEMIKNSYLEWTIVRPVTLSNGKLTKAYRVGTDISSNRFHSTVSRSDVADFMISQLTDERFIRKSPRIMM